LALAGLPNQPCKTPGKGYLSGRVLVGRFPGIIAVYWGDHGMKIAGTMSSRIDNHVTKDEVFLLKSTENVFFVGIVDTEGCVIGRHDFAHEMIDAIILCIKRGFSFLFSAMRKTYFFWFFIELLSLF
jgi:hypothetical protein